MSSSSSHSEISSADSEMSSSDSEMSSSDSEMSSSDLEMLPEMLPKISGFLKNCNRQHNVYFCSERELPLSSIEITVDKVGNLKFPLTDGTIKKLLQLSKKAKFGKGSETVLDETVRDTNEIPADKLAVAIQNDLFNQMLFEMRQELGLPPTTTLKPRLHNMLIYRPGQFFSEHRDGEKADGMIATLVVVLPVPHGGGDLIIAHNKEEHFFFSEDVNADSVSCAAFYADCCHQVCKVKKGHRIVLTYNLFSITEESHYMNYESSKLTKMLERYFEDFDTSSMEDVLKFVYFLDHSYTQHSLKWNMLKGTDIKNGSAMYNAAKTLNLIPHLALIEIKRKSRSEDREAEDLEEYGPSLSRCSEKINVSFWIGSNNEKLSYKSYKLNSNLICCTVKTSDFQPYFKEVDFGNEGYDVDFRYRRAAVILWPLSCDIRMKFIFNYTDMKNDFLEMLKVPEKYKTALKIINEAGAYLHNEDSLTEKDFITYVNFVIQIEDRDIAFKLLSPFAWQILDSDIIDYLAKLKNKYNICFVMDLLKDWRNGKKRKNIALKNISNIVTKFASCDIGVVPISFILEKEYSLIKRCIASHDCHMDEIKEFLKACELVKHCSERNFQVSIIDDLISSTYRSIDDLAMFCVELKKLQLFSKLPYFLELKSYIIPLIILKKKLLNTAENDWSILPCNFSCNCEYCFMVKEFLVSGHRVKQTWLFVNPEIYDHVQKQLNYSRFPVNIHITNFNQLSKVSLTKSKEFRKKSVDEFNKFCLYLSELEK